MAQIEQVDEESFTFRCDETLTIADEEPQVTIYKETKCKKGHETETKTDASIYFADGRGETNRDGIGRPTETVSARKGEKLVVTEYRTLDKGERRPVWMTEYSLSKNGRLTVVVAKPKEFQDSKGQLSRMTYYTKWVYKRTP